MGLFDKIKKAFTADVQEDNQSEESITEQTETPVDTEPAGEAGKTSETAEETESPSAEAEKNEPVASEEPAVKEPEAEPVAEEPEVAEPEKIVISTVAEVEPSETPQEPAAKSEEQSSVHEVHQKHVEHHEHESHTGHQEWQSKEIEKPLPVQEVAEPAVTEIETPASVTENTAAEVEDQNVIEAVSTETEEIAAELEQPVNEDTEIQQKYDKGLEKTRKSFGEKMNELFARFRRVDEDFFEELEETLIGADVGFDTAIKLTDALRNEVKLKNAKKPAQVQNVIVEKLVEIYEASSSDEDNELNLQQDALTVILFVGVNGTGKTTSIGKLANQYKTEGKKVLLAAADTFRAGAIDQLVVWGERSGVEVVRGSAGGDPAAVVFDAVKKAKEGDYDILLIDTAGRLQNKVNLMKELEKIKRIIQREIPAAPHEVLLVVDATTGQNAMVQARQFKEATDVSGIVLTKLDGTAKGGIVLAIRNELQLPVKLVGLGEGINDLEPFDSNEFAIGLFKGLLKAE